MTQDTWLNGSCRAICQVVRRRKEGGRKLPLTWDKTKKKMRGGKQQFGGIKTKKKEKRKVRQEKKKKEERKKIKNEEKEKKNEGKVKRGLWGGKTGFLVLHARKRNGRDREREKKRGSASLYDLRSSGGWISSGQDLKLIYLARATRGHRNQGVSTQFQISDFREVESFGV